MYVMEKGTKFGEGEDRLQFLFFLHLHMLTRITVTMPLFFESSKATLRHLSLEIPLFVNSCKSRK